MATTRWPRRCSLGTREMRRRGAPSLVLALALGLSGCAGAIGGKESVPTVETSRPPASGTSVNLGVGSLSVAKGRPGYVIGAPHGTTDSATDAIGLDPARLGARDGGGPPRVRGLRSLRHRGKPGAAPPLRRSARQCPPGHRRARGDCYRRAQQGGRLAGEDPPRADPRRLSPEPARHAAARDLRGARGHPSLLRLRLEVRGRARPLGEGSPRRAAARGAHYLARGLHDDAGRLPLAVGGPLDGIPRPLAVQSIFTAAEMRALDARAIETLGIPGPRLMENAGRGAAAVIAREWAPLRGKRVLVLCGRGNNGGDGFVVARHLHARGARVRVLLAGRRGDVKGDAAQALGRWRGKVEEIGDESGLGLLGRAFA